MVPDEVHVLVLRPRRPLAGSYVADPVGPLSWLEHSTTGPSIHMAVEVHITGVD